MQNRLERYLDEVSQPLPVTERQEWRTEAEQHLIACIKAYEELGHSHEDATELALAKFGEARIVGERMRVEAAKAVTMPLSLKFVASLWFWGGVKPLIMFGLTEHHPWYLVCGAFSFLVAAGLIRRHPFARYVALVWSVVQALSAIMLMYFLFSAAIAHPSHSSISDSLDQAALTFGLGAFQVWILTRPQVRSLFDASRIRIPIRLRR